MEKIETGIAGCFELQPRIFEDHRGRLVKTYHEPTYKDLGLDTNFTEGYYSVSAKGVLRGLHFQTPPHELVKCVTVLHGKVFDAVVDIRKGSPTYGKSFGIELSAEKGNMLYVPAGLAHGFYSMTEQAVFLYRTTEIYQPDSDGAIRWDSCGIEWPDMNPLVSEKDTNAPTFEEYETPFVF
ncbi:dTDP-4-dehydrorhamnose 3,5-epimerase [Flammeovirgaceae bacterium SG7u.111]|nr:dTDP-4-dehydrorhamnose 3,5-epimerase [Flammeovirgaceae bacterium SG7u.132]WPO37636.1 dTDP-4-dehydrorhamnose 3,5-epimerase [Flammeovirgaceae bacterium SG7u.111]